MAEKEEIIRIFRENIKGQIPVVDDRNQRHDGREGHWLEQHFGIHANASNSSDILGYELKNETTSKTTFGDWSANEYIFSNNQYPILFNASTKIANRNIFLKLFGKPNPLKDGRLSWSGEPCPKITRFNIFGQRLFITAEKDIVAEYSYSQDQRSNKSTIIPMELKQESLELARWYGQIVPEGKKGKTLKRKLEDKFNDKGWFTCKKDTTGAYCKICFGKPMVYDNWIELVRQGTVFFDSGMYETNARPYSQWRADNHYWNSLIEDVFE